MGAHLDQLPDEILHSILRYSSPTSSATLERTARRFRNVTNEPLLWRFFCQTLFNFWDKRHELSQKLASPVSFTDWKKLYVHRHLTDSTTTKALNSILASQAGRIEKFHSIIDSGYDAKDTLVRHSQASLEEDDHLARRYYSNEILNCLHRNIAILEWVKLANGEPVSLERALGAFDLFIPGSHIGDLDDITSMLDQIVVAFREEYPDIELLTPREKSSLIASYLRKKHLIGIQNDRDYYSVEHNFLGLALKDPGHNSLPLISAAIYCYLAQSSSLNAHPCGFPLHVHVVIIPEPGVDLDNQVLAKGLQAYPAYIDPFSSPNETAITDLRALFNALGATSFDRSAFLRGSSVSDIVLRCGKNLLNSIQQTSRSANNILNPAGIVSAKYAGLWSSILFSRLLRPIQLRQHLSWLMALFATDFPYDIRLIERYVVPLFRDLPEHSNLLNTLRVMQAVDEMPKQVRRRTTKHEHVKYRIGQVLRHQRYNYIAVIIGWDVECGADEQWMREMNIDQLQAGRYQSFYHVLHEDAGVRYIAEENIEIITPPISRLPPMFHVIAGKYFKRWDDRAGIFISNIRDEYPDD